ncbi:uncharacterized protein LOC129229214 [Uloborus diversus]|uniref:uncharacterized protein LOC129229214 n=1 Tax=Uloborus diversus TaxID=327109 RepID=UPI002409F4CF|nr:uncharacterized protein LOC129229214 [Uloborus diversus]
MARDQYTPQVDEPVSFVDGPPPAYPKGYSVRLQLIRLAAKTIVCLIALIGAFVLLAAYIHSTTSCSCEETNRRMEMLPESSIAAEALAQPEVNMRLHIGEDLRKHKGKKQLDCLVERREQMLDAKPSKGKDGLQVKGEQTVISCSSNAGKRKKRTPSCDCRCAC